MNTPIEPNTPDTRPQVNEQRRRLTKGGLAAPVVMGTLLSRPVLGAAPHHCTISGQVSGNMSTHDQSILCSTLGRSPSNWADDSPSSWPGSLTDSSGTPLLFNLAPSSTNPKFADVYSKGGADANVQEVLKGTDVAVKSGSATVELGQEAVAAYLNAADQQKYPITQQEVVAMFNAVVSGGTYAYSSTVSMNATQVLTFFKSLHG